jgi:glycosyltransferase involved in cell wall biosynthesis
VLVASQDVNVPVANGALRVPPMANWWELYDFGDVLLMPRRFGGLCLPIQEAMAAGLAVVALDTEPHDWYGCAAIEAFPAGEFETGSGQVTIWNARPSDVAVAVEQCVAELPRRVERSRQWAELHSWAELEMMWRVGLATAIVKRER